MPATSKTPYANGTPTHQVLVLDANNNSLGTKTFIVDSGASQTNIAAGLAKMGKFTPKGTKSFQGPTGPPFTAQKVGGCTMAFNVTFPDGSVGPVLCTLDVAIGALNLLGNDQLKQTKCIFINDPEEQSGELKRKVF